MISSQIANDGAAVNEAVRDALRRRMAGEPPDAVLGCSMAEHEKQLRRYAGHFAPLLVGINRLIGDQDRPPEERFEWSPDQIANGANVMAVLASDGSVVNSTAYSASSEDSTEHAVLLAQEHQIDGVRVAHLYAFHMASVVLGWPADAKYWLYRITFHVDPDMFDEQSAAVLKAGYWGITVRAVTQRWSEHQRDAFFGKGHLLHRVWSGLLRAKKPFTVQFTLNGCAASLAEIYRLEEQAVAADSLAPKGLNAIPGGEAGIRMLHSFSLLTGKKLPALTERDRALAHMERELEKRRSSATHYRRAHFRALPAGRMTWVSGCWVNAQTIAA